MCDFMTDENEQNLFRIVLNYMCSSACSFSSKQNCVTFDTCPAITFYYFTILQFSPEILASMRDKRSEWEKVYYIVPERV